MDRIFKIHCSQIGKIMGQIGLTDKQTAKLNELYDRKHNGGKALTSLMEVELAELIHERDNPTLPKTAITFLREWYADDREQIFSRYTDKGNYVESDLIDFMAEQLGLGMAAKNQQTMSSDYMIGTCDVECPDKVIDVKAPWNNTTLQQNVDGIDTDYEWQLRGYMNLWNKPKAVLFYGLMDTPPEVNYEIEVSYSHIPEQQRWIAYEITRNTKLEQDIINRVIMCRTWLAQYHINVTSRIGKIHSI